jgi:hypothetical protein
LQDEHELLSIRSYPPTTNPVIASQFATEMTQLNIYGQTALMIQRIQGRRDHLASLTAAAKVQRKQLQAISEDLGAELKDLQNAEILFDQAKKDTESTQGRVNFLNKSIALYRARPLITRIQPTKGQLEKTKVPRHRGATTVPTPVAGSRQTTPVSTPSTGRTSSGSVLSRPSFSSRGSVFGYKFNPNLGGNVSASSSDDEEEEESTNDKDFDINPTGKGDGKGDDSTGDGDETKEGEMVDKAD